MGIPIDITGQRFGKLTAIKEHHQGIQGRWHWLCKCDCGNKVIILGINLRNGNTKSCGCLKSEITAKRNKDNSTHNLSKHTLYIVHRNMMQRCYNNSNTRYLDYGGRGITVYQEWHDLPSFYTWALTSGYEEHLTIDRIDNNGNYCPENCRWVTQQENQNNKRTNKYITYNGRVHTISEWSRILKIAYCTLYYRLSSNWTIEEALTTPVGEKRRR
jgi:hypothetical protein